MVAKVRALIRPGARALAWLLPGVWIAWRAANPAAPAELPPRPLLVPLAPATWQHTGATHVALVAGPGHLWAVLPERTRAAHRAVRIHEHVTQFPGQQSFYPRVTRLELVATTETSPWYDARAADAPRGATVWAIDYGLEHDGRFEVRVRDHALEVAGNPTFPAMAPPGALAEILSPALLDELRPWCEIANDLDRVSRNHQTFHTLVATRVANAVGALCCMSDMARCRGRD